MKFCLRGAKSKSCVGHFTHQNNTSIYRMSTNFVQEEGKFSRAGFLEMTRATFSHQWSQMWGWLSPVYTRVMALGLWKFLISLASGYMYFPALNKYNFEFVLPLKFPSVLAAPPPPALFSMCWTTLMDKRIHVRDPWEWTLRKVSLSGTCVLGGFNLNGIRMTTPIISVMSCT